MLNHWLNPLLYGVGVFAILELAYLLLRRALPRFRLRLVYHLWALLLGLLVTLYQARMDPAQLLWQMTTAAAAVTSALVLFVLLDVLILQRPWAPTAPPMLPKLARDVLGMVFLVAVGLLVAKEILNQPLGAVLVSSTVLSAVVGLALQDVLRNVFAGMALDIERPVQRGDWLILDGQTPVQVTDLSWRSMRLRTNEGVEISEPNANVASARLVNYGSGDVPMALGFRVGLPYEAPPTEVKKALEAAARSVPDALDSPPIRVMLESFDDHSIGYYMRVWTLRVAEMKAFQDEVNTRIWYQLKRRGLYVPFPIRTLHMNDAGTMAEDDGRRELEQAERLLAELELFRELEPSVVRELAVAAERQYYDNDEILVREGDSGESLYVILSGRVAVSKVGTGIGELDVAHLGAGEFFGEHSLLTGEDRSATVMSEGGSVVLRLSKESVAPMLQQDPKIAETLSRALVIRQEETRATVESHKSRLREASVEDQRSVLAKIRSFFNLG